MSKLSICFAFVLLLGSNIAFSASVDMSAWSDKTVCRLAAAQEKESYITEAQSRGLTCVKSNLKAEPVKVLMKSNRIEVFIIEADITSPIDEVALPEGVLLNSDFDTVECKFRINRRALDRHEIYTIGSGKLTITSGKVVFGENSWTQKGLSSPEYLKRDAKLIVGNDGHVYGTMPYFHYYVSSGEVPVDPIIVKLVNDRRSVPFNELTNLKTAKFKFSVNEYNDGELIVEYCKYNGTTVDDSKQSVESLTDHKRVYCTYDMIRILNQHQIDRIGEGAFEIVNGGLQFKRNVWWMKGKSSPEYLKKDAKLTIGVDGHLYGIMPYFSVSINDGEVPVDPTMVALGKNAQSTPFNIKSDNSIVSKETEFRFKVNEYNDGVLRPTSCW